jgi:hypothetical protein
MPGVIPALLLSFLFSHKISGVYGMHILGGEYSSKSRKFFDVMKKQVLNYPFEK